MAIHALLLAYLCCSYIGEQLKLHIIRLDLADLASVKEFVAEVQAFLNGRKLDILVTLC